MFDLLLLFIQLGSRFHPSSAFDEISMSWMENWSHLLSAASLVALCSSASLLGKKMMFPTTNFSTRVQVIPDALFRDS